MGDGTFDVIVVGGGAMGTAAARHLAARGQNTLLLERSTFGHADGSSGGPTRIFRFMYHTPGYARMAMEARSTWDELQEACGEPLLRIIGGVDLGVPAMRRAEVLESVGAAVQRLQPQEALERWPDLQVPEGVDIVFSPDGGVVRAARTVQVQARLADEAGATVRERTRAVTIAPEREGASVLTEREERFWAPTVVVTAGPWAGPLLRGAGIDLSLRPSLEQATYFRLREPPSPTLETDSPLPTMIDWSWDEDHPPYLVPDPFASEPGHFKVGLHHAGPEVEADSRTFDPDPVRVSGVQSWVDRHVAGAEAVGRTDTCLYTVTPDEDFVLDRIGPVVVASPCSGHGFKFVPLFGRVIADLATGDDPPFALEPFAADRPGLAPSAQR